MELKDITMEFDEDPKYTRAKKKVAEIKGFYSHLTIYLIINALLICVELGIFQNGLFNIRIPSWTIFTTPFFWGIGLAAHGIHVFYDSFKFLKNWEERKIQEILRKDEDEFRNNSDHNKEF